MNYELIALFLVLEFTGDKTGYKCKKYAFRLPGLTFTRLLDGRL